MIYLLAVPAAPAILILAAAWLDRPKGRHRLDGDKAASWFRSLATEAPAPGHGWVQEPRPGDPPSANGAVRAGAGYLDRPVPYWPAYLPAPAPRGAVRAGQAETPAAGPPWQPAAAAILPPPDGAATLPQPASLGLGQPFPPEVVPYPDGNYAIRGADGEWRIRPLAWDGRSPRETGGQPALVRSPRAAFEAWQDMAVNS